MSVVESRQPKPAREQHPQATDEHALPTDLPRPNTFVVILVVVAFVGLLAGLFVLGWIPHQRAAAQALEDAKAQSTGSPVVGVMRPKVSAAGKDLFLPCDVRPNQQTAIYARANGYLKQWLVDIGDRVKAGQLLAVIDAPDVDAQLAQTKATLEQAKATVVKAQADLDVADTDYQRYLTSQKDNPGSVTQQDVDTKRGVYTDAVGALAVARAAVTQAAAQVQQLTVTQGFERVSAPFSGTITARNYDLGALLNPANATAKEMFDIAETDTLRVFVNVPQSYGTDIRTGQPAFLTVKNYPDREFKGTIARTAGAMDEASRTLPIELDFPNPDGLLYAGMYGQARLPIAVQRPALVIPSSALLFNAGGLQVATVREGKVHFEKITVGRDLGTEVEVAEGLVAEDQVVTNPGERLVEGGDVQVTSQEKTVAGSTHAAAN